MNFYNSERKVGQTAIYCAMLFKTTAKFTKLSVHGVIRHANMTYEFSSLLTNKSSINFDGSSTFFGIRLAVLMQKQKTNSTRTSGKQSSQK